MGYTFFLLVDSILLHFGQELHLFLLERHEIKSNETQIIIKQGLMKHFIL